jgi:hypothetical protein
MNTGPFIAAVQRQSPHTLTPTTTKLCIKLKSNNINVLRNGSSYNKCVLYKITSKLCSKFI